ncbi:homoserine O-succinyltransferase MetX [Litoribacillus peritrichatus]|uniref:Homoserine O-succinyltransferase n=1 Tax=Litoribacillus peritrichatus TaxID=718191 RepID=A0ABP7MNI6_9GAMM
MPAQIPENSVGIVEPQVHQFDEPLKLRSEQVLPNYQLMVETYGTLNQDASNAVLICHALSGDHHAAGYHAPEDKKPGWWDSAIGPNKPIDTNKFFVVSLNNLGGCAGSTGPTSINPETGKVYGSDFPIMCVRDWVNSQARLADRLGIQKWAAVVGGSLGGMQALRWSIQYPERVANCVVIASAPKLTTQNIAFNEVARQAIIKDPEFHDGHYLEKNTIPKGGLTQARMLGHITYLSDDGMALKFGRDLKTGKLNFNFDSEFEIESYLRYQGERFSNQFDANTYLLMTKALDYFDPAAAFDNELSECFKSAQCKFMVMSFSSDWRFSPKRSEEIVNALMEADKDVSYVEIESDKGHDAFLLPIPRYMQVFDAFMQQVALTQGIN